MPAEIRKTEVFSTSYDDDGEPVVFHYLPSGYAGLWIQVREDLHGVETEWIRQDRMDEIKKMHAS